jgi:hypothetical protein
MSNRGVFAIDRGIFDHPIFAPEPYTEREAWIWMVRAAAWKSRTVRVGRHMIDLERGQLAFSMRFLASKFKWPPSRVVRYIRRLETGTMVSTQATREATHLTICNYNKYAFGRNTNETPTETPSDTLAVHSRYKEEERKEREEERAAPAATLPVESNQSKAKTKRTERRATAWPERFALDADMRAYAAKHGWSPTRQDVEFEKYGQHALQSGRRLKDWVADWRSWVLKGIEYDRARPGASAPAPIPDASAINWDSRVEKFKNNGLWPLPWGPQPGSAGCRAPPDVLARKGFGQAEVRRVAGAVR